MATESETVERQAPSFAVDLVSGPPVSGGVDAFELAHARRALALLKSRIGRQGLLDLLAADIEEGNDYLRERAELSGGKFKSGTTVLAVRGLKAGQFVRWLTTIFSDEPALLAAEPEHFVIFTNPDTTVTVVENLGPYVSRVLLPGYGVAATWAEEAINELLPEADFPFRRLADLSLPDGTVVGRVLNQFGDTDEGFTAHLTCYFPVECADEFVEHHREHLAVEFRNWITAAAAAQQ
ncbi:hypothetical protein ACWKSP_23145 [Micromonosporaceae bacterium Da 78-11]